MCVTPPPRLGWGAPACFACHEHCLEGCDEFWRCRKLVTMRRRYKKRLTIPYRVPTAVLVLDATENETEKIFSRTAQVRFTPVTGGPRKRRPVLGARRTP